MKLGPVEANTADGYTGFVNSICQAAVAAPAQLYHKSIEWKFEKPANSSWTPLREPAAYLSLQKQVVSRSTSKTPQLTNITLRMR